MKNSFSLICGQRDADGGNREVRTTVGWPAERAGRAPTERKGAGSGLGVQGRLGGGARGGFSLGIGLEFVLQGVEVFAELADFFLEIENGVAEFV
jgi:hypothetical protein